MAVAAVISLHLPLTDATDKLIDGRALERMKPQAVLINTSRGGIIDKPALTEALRNRRIAAAGLDVFAEEPVDPANPLLALSNVVVTPHVTWYTVDTMRRYLTAAIDNCRRLRDGMPLMNVVGSG